MTGREVANAVGTVAMNMSKAERSELALVLTGDKTGDALHACIRDVVIRAMRNRSQSPQGMQNIFDKFDEIFGGARPA